MFTELIDVIIEFCYLLATDTKECNG